jgi:ABC-type polysaccharide/polyol phosphate export permease
MSEPVAPIPATDAGPAPEEGWVSARAPRPREVLARLVTFPALVAAHRDLVTTSVRRELAARFHGTVLGWLWPLVHPVFLFAVYYFVFTQLLAQRLPSLPAGQEAAMGVYMFTGVIVWTAFAEPLVRGTSVIVDNGNLIKKLAFPSELLPLTVVLTSTVTLLFALAVFLLACWVSPLWPAPGAALLWLPALIVLQGLFAYGIVLLTSTLQVFLRDTSQTVGILATVWMFVSPVFWIPELVPAEALTDWQGLLRANPMHALLDAWRGVLMGEVSIPAMGELPARVVVTSAAVPDALLRFALWALGSYAIGYAFFVLAQRRFADEV